MANKLTLIAPDPIDGLRTALLQQRRGRLVRTARGRGAPIWFALILAACGLIQVAVHHYWLGVLMIAMGTLSFWSLRQTARQQMRELDRRIDAMAAEPDGAIAAAAAGAARTLILRDPG
ncbi:MAG TPA: hypothetical protein VMP00_06350 [Burkholderiales bacterium]|nr:hypothetical protein [Burkholderiales bacterium]